MLTERLKVGATRSTLRCERCRRGSPFTRRPPSLEDGKDRFSSYFLFDMNSYWAQSTTRASQHELISEKTCLSKKSRPWANA